MNILILQLRRSACSAVFAILLLGGAGAVAPALAVQTGVPEETWNSIRPDIFDEREILDGAHLMVLETPKRAEDAALVPFNFRPKGDVQFSSVTIIIDENPAPVAGVFRFGPGAAIAAFSTRFRVNSYSYVRAIAEGTDGQLYMVRNFIKASGGCSAPATKGAGDIALGTMKFRSVPVSDDVQSAQATSDAAAGQIMIRHPNYSGLQMNQLTRLYIPARFINEMEIYQGERIVLTFEGGISLSENPSFRFYFKPNGGKTISVRATDTDGENFSGSWSAGG